MYYVRREYIFYGNGGITDRPADWPGSKGSGCLPGRLRGGDHAFVFIPLAMSHFSADGGQQYLPISSTVDTFFVWTLGLTLYTPGREHQTGDVLPILKKLANPIMGALALMFISGAPAMTTSCTIAGQYDLDEEFAAAMVLVSTLGCMITIPLLFFLTGWM